MKVVLIANTTPEQRAALATVDPRLEIEDAWELFAPELVADWPAYAVHGYLPARLREMADSPEQRARRDALLAEAEVVCIGFPFPTRLVSRAPKLKLVQQTPAGVSNLTHGDLWGTSVPVCSGRGVASPGPIAEWALAMTFALCKEIPRNFAQRAAGQFDRQQYRARGVAGKTMGVVGLGGIGQEIARLASAVGMHVIGTRRSAGPVPNVERVYPPSELCTVLGESDVVALATQLTAETEGLMNAGTFAAMKPGAFLLNVARGELIDEAALAEALASGQVGGFAADVYVGEFDHPPPPTLLAFQNVMITPHTSGMVERPASRAMEVFRENLRRLLEGVPLLNQVDWARGY